MAVRWQTPRALRFHDLMWYRVSEVLLVSSPYDAFILEQDGQLTEQVFREYSDLSLPAPPRFTHAPTGEAAMQLLEVRRFDLVLTMTSLADMDVNAFGRRVKELRPGRPVVLLALDRAELHDLEHAIDREAIDGAFLWTGDAKILLAIVQHVEDRENLDLDLEHGNLKVILVIEDSPAYYSAFLGLLYRELTAHALSLYAEGANKIHRQMYMKTRPKILHAASFEEGHELFERYQKHLLAIIGDVGIPRDGELDPKAGIDFVRRARRVLPDLPVLLQSADPVHQRAADEMGAGFIDKNSPDLLAQIRDFLTNYLGFGDFVFRLEDGTVVDRAGDLRELEEKIATIPDESLAYHARHNHFSIWLAARSEFELADLIRPQSVADFGSVGATRRYLVKVLRQTHRRRHRGVVADFDRRRFEQDPFSRLGHGSLGGKARGIAFLNMLLAELEASDFGGLAVRLPKTVVITTEHFDAFLDQNDLRAFAYGCEDEDEITARFLAAPLPEDLLRDLAFLVAHLKRPLAVRSSSLLEDSRHQRLAGIYTTLMLPNNSPHQEVRLRRAADAVKRVFASTFGRNARSYLHSTGKRLEEEKMAVILQEVVGESYGPRFYPAISGVAQSYNFYPIGPQQAEDGVVHLALGFGRQVVDGGEALRFSPQHPGVTPQFADPKTLLDRSQRGFYALDVSRPDGDGADGRYGGDPTTAMRRYDVDAAEEDGTLRIAGSVYSPDDRQIREDLKLPGPRLVTFNNVLKHRAIPLPEALARLLEIGEEGLGCAVEVEFACELGDWGRPARPGKRRRPPRLYPLQIRPFASAQRLVAGPRLRFAPEDRLCVSSRSLGNGVVEGIRDLVYVDDARWEAAANRQIAEEVGELNAALADDGRPYLLIGPGRWGTADEWLGIPVQWSQISKVKVLVEASPEGYDVEPSQGAHFFHNLSALELGYLHLPPGADGAPEDADGDFLDRRWLDAQPAHRETEHLRWLRFDRPLTVVLDGRRGRGVVARPGASGEGEG